VPAISASEKTHLTNLAGDQHAWQLYLTIGNIQRDIHSTPKMRAWILVDLIPCPRKVPKTQTKHCIPQLELYCPNLGIMTLLAPA